MLRYNNASSNISDGSMALLYQIRHEKIFICRIDSEACFLYMHIA